MQLRGDDAVSRSDWQGVAARQHGVISRAQLRALGFSKDSIWRAVRAGKMVEALPGTFRAASAPVSWEQDLTAALLWAGNARASHRSAAALLELDGFPRGPIEITTTRSLRAATGIVLHRVATLHGYDTTTIKGFRCSTAARTLLELGAVAAREEVELALEDALRRRVTTLRAVRWELRTEGRSGRNGTSTLKALLECRPDGYVPTESALEVRLDRLLRTLELPAFKRQHTIATPLGTVRPDFAFVEYKVAVEADSYRWHSGRAAWEKDKRRARILRNAGWEVVTVTARDLNNQREEVIVDLYSALDRGGWTRASSFRQGSRIPRP